mgnify:CR=1 FL=1
MSQRRFLTIISLLFFLCSSTAFCADAKKSIPYGFDILNDLSLLPILKEGVVCLQHSSYDRTGGNDDGFSGTYTALRRTEAGEYVIFDAEGPGCIYRFWSAMPPEGWVKFFFDDETEPRINCNFQEMFQDKVPPFASPLTGQSSGGWYSYFPISFAKRCIIVTEKKTGFLAIAYHRFPAGTPIKTFKPNLDPVDKAKFDVVQAYYADPAKKETDANLELKWMEIPAGDGEFELAKFDGPATIERIHMKLKMEYPEQWQQDHTFRKVVLRFYWDGDKKPAIECPIGEFFGTGFGETRINPETRKTEINTYSAVPFGMTNEFAYFSLPMPFRKSARITVENGTGKPQNLGWAVQSKKGNIPQNAAYLHIQWRNYFSEMGKHVPILETTGRGHFVGTILSMQSPYWLRYLEGDEKIYVDGETKPGIHGTGTEDYFGGAWCFGETFNAPFLGYPYHSKEPEKVNKHGLYRWHIMDPIRFTKDLKVTMQALGWTRDGKLLPLRDDICSTAYWYQKEPHTKFPKLIEPPKRWPR